MGAIKLDASAVLTARVKVVDENGDAITNTNGTDYTLKELVIAVIESIPTQADDTSTAAKLVTALKTIP